MLTVGFPASLLNKGASSPGTHDVSNFTGENTFTSSVGCRFQQSAEMCMLASANRIGQAETTASGARETSVACHCGNSAKHYHMAANSAPSAAGHNRWGSATWRDAPHERVAHSLAHVAVVAGLPEVTAQVNALLGREAGHAGEFEQLRRQHISRVRIRSKLSQLLV